MSDTPKKKGRKAAAAAAQPKVVVLVDVKVDRPMTFAELAAGVDDDRDLVEVLVASEKAGKLALDWADGPGNAVKYAVHDGRYLLGARPPPA